MFENTHLIGSFYEVFVSHPEFVSNVFQQTFEFAALGDSSVLGATQHSVGLIAQSEFELNQLDPEQFEEIIEQYGTELPEDWKRSFFANQAA